MPAEIPTVASASAHNDGWLVLSRSDMAAAIDFWGHQAPAVDSISLSKEVSKLVDVLATMDFRGETTARIKTDSERGRLLCAWQQAKINFTQVAPVDADHTGSSPRP